MLRDRAAGVVRDMLFINGKFPGPLIELNRGDRLLVNVTNQLKTNTTAIHWHGLFQNGTNWFDGTQGTQSKPPLSWPPPAGRPDSLPPQA